MSAEMAQRVLISKAAYARHRDCSPPYVSKLCRDGKIVQVGSLIDRDASDAALANLADPSKAAVLKSNAERYGKQSPLIHPDEQYVMANLPQIPKAEPPSPPPQQSEGAMLVGSYAEAKRDRERSLADRAKWDLDVEKGLYVSRDIAGQLAFQAGRSWRDQLTEVQNTLPTAIISIIKQHLPSAPGDEVLKIQHAITESVLSAHRAALTNVAKEISDLAQSLDAAPN